MQAVIKPTSVRVSLRGRVRSKHSKELTFRQKPVRTYRYRDFKHGGVDKNYINTISDSPITRWKNGPRFASITFSSTFLLLHCNSSRVYSLVLWDRRSPYQAPLILSIPVLKISHPVGRED
jgi:hypothetical protein